MGLEIRAADMQGICLVGDCYENTDDVRSFRDVRYASFDYFEVKLHSQV